MRVPIAIASAALFTFACAGSNAETRSASNSPATYGAGANTSPNTASDAAHHTTPIQSQTTVAQSTSDNTTGIRTVTGPIAAINGDSIQFAPANGSALNLKIDSSTQVLRDGQALSQGLQALHEGQQVRASYDAGQNHVSRIELINNGGMIQGVNGTAPHAQQPKPPSDENQTPQDTRSPNR